DGQLWDRRLFAIFHPTCFTLLVFGERHAPPALPPEMPPEVNVVAIDERMDPGFALTERYNASGGAPGVVRPDGHVGFRGSRHSLAALRAYLSRISLAGSRPMTF